MVRRKNELVSATHGASDACNGKKLGNELSFCPLLSPRTSQFMPQCRGSRSARIQNLVACARHYRCIQIVFLTSTASESAPATVDGAPAANQQVPAPTAPDVEVLNGRKKLRSVRERLFA